MMSNLRCLESFLGNLHTPRYFWNKKNPPYNVDLNKGIDLLLHIHVCRCQVPGGITCWFPSFCTVRSSVRKPVFLSFPKILSKSSSMASSSS